MEFVIASSNKGKIKEFEEILLPLGIKLKTAKELGFTDEIDETGTTFAENAFIKAQTVAKALGKPAIADDSGICVEALDFRPGVYSARYADTDYECCVKMLDEMQGKTNRTAYFQSNICLVFGNGDKIESSGRVYGEIALQTRGDGGFGYDPLFYVKEFDKTIAELTSNEKNEISHRGKSLAEFYVKLKEYYNVK